MFDAPCSSLLETIRSDHVDPMQVHWIHMYMHKGETKRLPAPRGMRHWTLSHGVKAADICYWNAKQKLLKKGFKDVQRCLKVQVIIQKYWTYLRQYSKTISSKDSFGSARIVSFRRHDHACLVLKQDHVHSGNNRTAGNGAGQTFESVQTSVDPSILIYHDISWLNLV